MNLAETLEIPAEIMPQAPILGTEDGPLDLAALLAGAGAVADRLRARGLGAGDVVATVQGLSGTFAALLYGTVATGAVLAPLNARAKAPELAALLERLRPALLVADERYEGLVREAAARAGVELEIELTGDVDLGAAGALAAVEPDDGATAVLLHTSGTTGRPKPVPLTHEALTAALLRTALPADGTPRGTTVLAAPNHHVAGLSVLLASVFSGRAAELLPAFSSAGWLAAVARSGADHAFVVPTMLRRILDDPGFAAADLSSLRTLAYGAAPMPRATIVEALARFPATCGFVASYGQTETGGTICVLGPGDHAAARAGDAAALARLGSIGRPIEGVELAILDDAGAALPPDAAGEIAVRLDGGDWRRTGDLGLIDTGGYVYLTSRKDDLIIRGGENIDPAEVEQALADHPGVADVAVVGAPDEEWGEVVVAFVVPRPGAVPAEPELIDHAKRALASFKAPARVHHVDELPRTDLGKLKRRELAARPEAMRGGVS